MTKYSCTHKTGDGLEIRDINEKIRRIRLSRNITLKALAEKTCLTDGYLSRIENSETAPPIATLVRIAEGLGIDVSYFFIHGEGTNGENPHIAVDRQSTGQQDGSSPTDDYTITNGYRYRLLFPEKQGKNLQPYVVSPDFEIGPSVRLDGELLIYVIEGKVEFFYGDENYCLGRGDSLYFDASIPYSARSLGEERAKLLVIAYPYRRL